MAEEGGAGEDNASKLINAAAREMVRVVKHPATDEYLILLDTSAVPENAVLLSVSKWGTPLEKGAKNSEVTDDNVFVCKPLKTRNPERRPGKEPAQPSYKLIKRHTGRFHPFSDATAALATAAEPKKKRAKKAANPSPKGAAAAAPGKAREEPSRKLLEDALKAIKEYTRQAK